MPILREELRLLVREGVSVVQIDDPHLCLFVDPDVRAKYDDPDRAADFAVDMTNEVVDGVGGVKLAVHLCRRAGARARGEARFQGGYGPILPQLNRLKVHHLTMEFTAPEAGDMAVFRDLRDGLRDRPGVRRHRSPGVVDSVDEIVGRVEAALRHLAPERITLNPDCGFAPGSAAVVSIDEVYQKLKNEVAAARRLRERYGGRDWRLRPLNCSPASQRPASAYSGNAEVPDQLPARGLLTAGQKWRQPPATSSCGLLPSAGRASTR